MNIWYSNIINCLKMLVNRYKELPNKILVYKNLYNESYKKT